MFQFFELFGVESAVILPLAIVLPALVAREIFPNIFPYRRKTGIFLAIVLAVILSLILLFVPVVFDCQSGGIFCGIQYFYFSFLVIPASVLLTGVTVYPSRSKTMLLTPDEIKPKPLIRRYKATVFTFLLLVVSTIFIYCTY